MHNPASVRLLPGSLSSLHPSREEDTLSEILSSGHRREPANLPCLSAQSSAGTHRTLAATYDLVGVALVASNAPASIPIHRMSAAERGPTALKVIRRRRPLSDHAVAQFANLQAILLCPIIGRVFFCAFIVVICSRYPATRL
ncbi:hypothetical protein BD410DRAFT_828812 [Rickenella mellea]|uniref:Uncharacterized protein n=1 Tax=Rickenella mellea TaxID=50990 RepID=A0A4Y7Q3U5_9AGAM|nr:hypothetical protein BD410DRAFT_828812 [Rickenella mellea]